MSDTTSTLRVLEKNHVDRVVFGPENHLALGLADVLLKEGFLVTGPTLEAAKLETDKAWAAEFMSDNGIPRPKTFVPIDYRAALDMVNRGTPFKGILYAGLMLTGEGLRVIEYNARFGDPETQPLMMMLESDLLEIFQSMDTQTLLQQQVKFRDGNAVCVVLAAPGYPYDPVLGQEIKGLDTITNPNVQVFHSGTERKNELLVVSGGRTLGITAYGKTVEEVRNLAYENAEKIEFEGMQYRRDIAA